MRHDLVAALEATAVQEDQDRTIILRIGRIGRSVEIEFLSRMRSIRVLAWRDGEDGGFVRRLQVAVDLKGSGQGAWDGGAQGGGGRPYFVYFID